MPAFIIHKQFTIKISKTIDILVKVCYNIDTVRETKLTEINLKEVMKNE